MACDWKKAKYLQNHMGILKQVAKLGEGTFGDVAKAHDKRLHKDFAAKTFKNGLEYDFIKEVSALRLFNHRHIIKINRVLFDRNNIPIMILPLVDSDLSRMINRKEISTRAVANALFVQLVRGMHHIQNRGFMHLDLKPGNILCSNVQKDGMCHLQIADFGLVHKHSGKKNPTSVQTLWYRSPEICLEYQYYDMSADTFSVGLIYLEMLTQERQTSEDDRWQVKNSILIAGLSSGSIPSFWKSLPKFLKFQKQSIFPYMQREFVHNEAGVHDAHKLKTFEDRVLNVDALSVAILTNLLHLDFSQRFLPDEKTCQSLLNPETADRRFIKFQPTTFAFTLTNNNVFQNLWSFSDFYKTQEDKIRRGEVVVPESMKCDHKGVDLKFRLRHIEKIVETSLAFGDPLDARTILAGIGIFDRLTSVRCLPKKLIELLVSCCMHISCCLYEEFTPELREWCYMAGHRFEVADLEEGIQKTMYCLKYDMYRPCLIDTFQFGTMENDNERSYIELLTLLYYMMYNAAYLPQGLFEPTVSHDIVAEWEKGPVYVANLILADAKADYNKVRTNPRDNVFRRLRHERQRPPWQSESAYAVIIRFLATRAARFERGSGFTDIQVKSSTNAGCNLFACNIIHDEHDEASMPPLFESSETRSAVARSARTTKQSAKQSIEQPPGRVLRPRALAERALAFYTH